MSAPLLLLATAVGGAMFGWTIGYFMGLNDQSETVGADWHPDDYV